MKMKKKIIFSRYEYKRCASWTYSFSLSDKALACDEALQVYIIDYRISHRLIYVPTYTTMFNCMYVYIMKVNF